MRYRLAMILLQGGFFLLPSGELLSAPHCCFSMFAVGWHPPRKAKQPVAAQFAFAHLAALSTFGGWRPSLLYNIMCRRLTPYAAFSLLPDVFFFRLLPANYRLPGTNYGLVAANYGLVGPNDCRAPQSLSLVGREAL
ncbi:hypothetical protein [Alloprevotella tannerae]|uniref:hypothetical protein n=1 Tax=Alloprevotella tannerae TaxID=76122 RepID=UPI0028F11FCD|nr:hypothetical protein [Alloprevotella tannerae]